MNLSIIIPIYNVEEYLQKSVRSVIEQSYNNLQIILVNDGSPDSCGQICDDLSKVDDRIIVIHKEYGRQFKISTFEKLLPETEDSIERYLSNGPIKGIGPSTATKIINYRKENGKFNNIEDIKNINGIGDSKYEQIKNLIKI